MARRHDNDIREADAIASNAPDHIGNRDGAPSLAFPTLLPTLDVAPKDSRRKRKADDNHSHAPIRSTRSTTTKRGKGDKTRNKNI